MATNPMQRKARNSFLLGMLVMLIYAINEQNEKGARR